MDMKEALLSILINLQKKYNKLNEVLDLTKEMETALQRNDQVSFRMVLVMRQDVMIRIDKIDATTKILLQAIPQDICKVINRQMCHESKQANPESEEEKKIGELYAKIQRLLEKIITIDRVMNKKIAGKDSYYAGVQK